uniref:Alpha-carbonic anhydrase domain-containing protein n=1 Tax=Macrostomum lignano TaxID=282301 RepID=A0A1I8FV02_9PLAT
MARVTSHIVKEVNGGASTCGSTPRAENRPWDLPKRSRRGHLTTVHDPSFFAAQICATSFRWWSSFLWQKFSQPPGSRAPSRESSPRQSWCCTRKTYLFGKNVKFVEMTSQPARSRRGVPGVRQPIRQRRIPALRDPVHHSIYMQRWVPNIVATVYLNGEAFQFERDIMIWNNKEFKDKAGAGQVHRGLADVVNRASCCSSGRRHRGDSADPLTALTGAALLLLTVWQAEWQDITRSASASRRLASFFRRSVSALMRSASDRSRSVSASIQASRSSLSRTPQHGGLRDG